MPLDFSVTKSKNRVQVGGRVDFVAKTLLYSIGGACQSLPELQYCNFWHDQLQPSEGDRTKGQIC